MTPRRAPKADDRWGTRLLTVLEQQTERRNWRRGRAAYREGRVLDFELGTGLVHGEVTGSQLHPFAPRVAIAPLDADARADFERHLAEEPGTLTELVGGRIARSLAPSLLAIDPHQVQFSCTCPDPTVPCVHAVALLSAVAAVADDDPRQFLALRGVRPEDVLAEVAATPERATGGDWFGGGRALLPLPSPAPASSLDERDAGALARALALLDARSPADPEDSDPATDERTAEAVAALRRLYTVLQER